MTDYERIEKAIVYLREHFREQPDLDEVARQVYLSPFHFQRMFTSWAGVSPKKFLQYISVEHAKNLLSKNLSILETSFETGLSGSSRLHDLFISIEGMTPGEYKNGGSELIISYQLAQTLFGEVLVASTAKGICHLAFTHDKEASLQELFRAFPHARFREATNTMQQKALAFFRGDWSDLPQVKLHLKGTPFQLKVWSSLLKIPFGEATTYGALASAISQPNASRAVGSAVGANPVAFLIPCHRVIRSTGVIGDYHWGPGRKTAILGWEAAQLCPSE